jgi:hypothetical protein
MNKNTSAITGDRIVSLPSSIRQEINEAIAKFSPMRPSGIGSHSGRCCQVAREWFRAQSLAQHELSSLPAPWMRERWNWGPLERPIHWCDILKQKTIDCAALASLTLEALHAVGTAALPVQILEAYDDQIVQNWEFHWQNHGGGYWTHRRLVYHEVVAVETSKPGHIRIWDPTEECYCEQRPNNGHGALVAVRVLADDDCAGNPNRVLTWRQTRLRPNAWQILTG